MDEPGRPMRPSVGRRRSRGYDRPTGRHARNTVLVVGADMDALSDVLRVAHLTGGVFLHAAFFAPCRISARIPPEHCAPPPGPAPHSILYHYVVEGDFRIRVDGQDGEDLVIGAGEVVLLPRNDL